MNVKYIFLVILLNCNFAFSLQLVNECIVCECKPQNRIQTCDCKPSTDKTECERSSHKLLISDHEILIPKKYSLEIIQSIIVKNININKLMVSFTNELVPKLYRLEFDNCNLTQIKKEAFFNVQNITHLILKNNPELHLETDSFAAIKNLTYLDLENNNLSGFPANIFGQLIKLYELYLDLNQLQNISKETLQPLINLQKIQIRKNDIESVKNDLFESNINLKTINLNGNKIEFLNRTFIQHLNKLQYLFLDNNPLNCNCSLRDFFDEYKRREDVLVISGECSNNAFKFVKMEKRHFNCPAKLINITSTQNDNLFNLNCTIESDDKPNAMWLYENNSLAGIEHHETFIINASKLYYLILELEVDPLKYYENNITCLVVNSNETLFVHIIYSPDISENISREVVEFGIKNETDKIILTHNFTISDNNDFNLTWEIQTLESISKNISFIFNVESNEFSVNLVLNHSNFTGKCTLFVIDESSEFNVTKNYNNKSDMNMTELLFSFQYKDKDFYIVDGNNSLCFVNKTQFVDSELGENYQYSTCMNNNNNNSNNESHIIISSFLIIPFILVIFSICCKLACRYKNSKKQHNQEIELNNQEELLKLNAESDYNSNSPINKVEIVQYSPSLISDGENGPNQEDSKDSATLQELEIYEGDSKSINSNSITDIQHNSEGEENGPNQEISSLSQEVQISNLPSSEVGICSNQLFSGERKTFISQKSSARNYQVQYASNTNLNLHHALISGEYYKFTTSQEFTSSSRSSSYHRIRNSKSESSSFESSHHNLKKK